MENTSKVAYHEIPSEEKVHHMPPPYVPHGAPVGDEESLLENDAPRDGCTPGRLCFASAMSALFCFWPAALIGMVFAMKARYAESNRAQRYMKVAKKCLWVSFIVGVVFIVVGAAIHMAMMAHMVKHAYKGAMRGYVFGTTEGETKGAEAAKALIANSQVAKFPEQIPGQASVFDITSPFWARIMEAEDVKDAAKTVGYSFGFVDGYKKGFCGTENADCTGVNMKTVVDYVQCEHMQRKMEKIKAKHMAHKEGDKDDDHKHNHKHGHHEEEPEAVPEADEEAETETEEQQDQ